MDVHDHFMTDGHVTVTRDDVTPQHLFDLAHDLLGRLDDLEWAFMCAVLIELRHLQLTPDPGEKVVDATLDALHRWMDQYQRDRARVEADRALMEAPE